MSGLNTQRSELGFVDSFSKLVAVSIGLLYFVGFLVVAGHLSQYGVSSFSVLQLQYLVAGFWSIGPPVGFALVLLTARKFEERAAPDIPNKVFNSRRFLMGISLTGGPYAIYFALLASHPRNPAKDDLGDRHSFVFVLLRDDKLCATRLDVLADSNGKRNMVEEPPPCCALAIREVGVDPEMLLIRLVSSIEVLSKSLTLDRKDDTFEQQKVTQLHQDFILACHHYARLIDESDLNREEKSELKNVFNVRKSRKKFVRFVDENSAGFFRGGNFKAKRLKIKRADLAGVLDVIYTARSKYLHAGEPMFLSQPIKGGEKWDTDPMSGMIADNRAFTAGQKLPYGSFFEGLVRQCLLNYLGEEFHEPRCLRLRLQHVLRTIP